MNKINNDKPKEDEIQKAFGGFGLYQILLILFMIPCKIPTATQPLSITFLAPPIDYECLDNNITSSNKCPCDYPEYDNAVFIETIVTTWDLICGRKWLVGLSQTVLMLGLLVGSIVFGILSDRYGRKIPLLVASALELASGILAGITSILPLFLFLRFLIGAAVGGILIISFVLVMEFTGKEHRELASALLQIPFNMGYLLLPLIGYYIRSWKLFQLAISIPVGAMILIYWFLPETPRWLLTAGKTEEAIKVVENAARINRKPVEGIRDLIIKHQEVRLSESVGKKGSLFDLVRTPRMRRNTICISINWVVCSFEFFGLSQYIGLLGGNIFINITISAVLNTVGSVVTYLCMKYMTRKTAMLTMHIISAVCLFIIAFIPKTNVLPIVLLACLANLCMFVAFIVIYLYSTEIFPTVVRNAGMGVASMLSRIGSMIAPFVAPLGSVGFWLPPVIFGVAPLIAAGLCLLLPETKGCNLPDTLDDGKSQSDEEMNVLDLSKSNTTEISLQKINS